MVVSSERIVRINAPLSLLSPVVTARREQLLWVENSEKIVRMHALHPLLRSVVIHVRGQRHWAENFAKIARTHALPLPLLLSVATLKSALVLFIVPSALTAPTSVKSKNVAIQLRGPRHWGECSVSHVRTHVLCHHQSPAARIPSEQKLWAESIEKSVKFRVHFPPAVILVREPLP